MRKKLGIIYYSGILLFFFVFSSVSYANDIRTYDEYETVAGDIIGIGGTGASVSSQVSSIRVNPAGIKDKRVYSLEGSYNKASFGGNFYQLGIIDNKTSSVGAGFLFSDFEDSVYSRIDDESDYQDTPPVKRRFYLALAMGNDTVSVGIMSNYTEAIKYTTGIDGNNIFERKKGFTFISPGILVNLGSFKLGLSAENLFNNALKDYNPRVYRFGASYHYATEFMKLAINLDYRGRERIQKEKEYDPSLKDLENMMFLGSSVVLYDIIKIMAGYGHEISGTNNRRSLSYGVALMKDDSSISIGCLHPYFKKFKNIHIGYNLSYSIVI